MTSRNRDGNKGGLLQTVQGVMQRGLDKIAQVTSGDDSLDALDLLRAQHRYVDKLFAQVEGARGAAKREAFKELADMLAIHATIEERIFYPAVKVSSTEELLFESAEEHLSVKRVLADLMEADAATDDFDAKLGVLQELVTHHAKKEEEAKLFPLVRAAVDADLLAGLASEMIALMVELVQEGNPRLQVPAETAEAAPI